MLEGRSGLNAALPYSVTLLSGPGPPPPPLVAGIVGYELAAGAAIRLAARPLGALALKVVNPLRPAVTRLSAREQYVFSCSLSHPIRPAPGCAALPCGATMSRQRTTASLECSGGTLKEKYVQQSAFVGRIVAAFINKHASKSILVVQLKPRD
jgi:hypothetical protein